ncbi:hypothetical protein ACU8KH_00393 [Lachancea thermotolerans]
MLSGAQITELFVWSGTGFSGCYLVVANSSWQYLSVLHLVVPEFLRLSTYAKHSVWSLPAHSRKPVLTVATLHNNRRSFTFRFLPPVQACLYLQNNWFPATTNAITRVCIKQSGHQQDSTCMARTLKEIECPVR